MDSIETVKAFFAALDSADMEKAEQYLADDYQLVDFTQQPMDKDTMLELIRLLKVALPNLAHSLSNIRIEENLVRLTVQRSGTNSGNLDLRKMGIGVIPSSHKFIIFPNGKCRVYRKGRQNHPRAGCLTHFTQPAVYGDAQSDGRQFSGAVIIPS